MIALRFPALFVALFFATLSGGVGRTEAGTKSDTLKYNGHSFVKIKTSESKVLYIDPFEVNDYSDSADIVLITHEHSDHNDLSRVRQKTECQVIRAANALIGGVYQSFTIGNIRITAVPAHNSYHSITSCVGYVVEFDSIKIYHAGDTGDIPEMADLSNQHITYALLPMDGIYTMTPQEATAAAATIHAAHDIPIHTMPPPDSYSTSIVANFTSPNKLVVMPGQSIELHPAITSVKLPPASPRSYNLLQVYPNPFNPGTEITYQLTAHGAVRLSVFDLLGREVAVLVSGFQESGRHIVRFDGQQKSSGIYFCRLEAGGTTVIQRMVLMK